MSTDPRLERIASLGDDFVRRRKQGELLHLEEFVASHPDFAEQLRDYVIAVEIVEEFKPDSADESMPLIPTGEKPDLPDYRIIRQIGRGGMGIVYEAEQLSLGRRVALKILPTQLATDPVSVQRFTREAKSAAALHHSNIVPVFDVGVHENCHFYAMQFILGSSLRDVVTELKRSQGQGQESARHVAEHGLSSQLAHSIEHATFAPVSTVQDQIEAPVFDSAPSRKFEDVSKSEVAHSTVVDQLGIDTKVSSRRRSATYYDSIAELGIQIAEALHYAHENGILHRDIKPANLLIDLKGNIWVVDFGLAKFEDDDLTKTGDFVGTLRYMSPERFEGTCDARSDIYSLGVTLYELIALRPAFDSANQLSLLEQVRNADAPRLGVIDQLVPADLETIISKSIQKLPRQRYASARELAEDLRRFVDRRPIKARKVSALESLAIWSRRNRTVANLLALLALVLITMTLGSVIAAFKFYEMAIQQTQLAAGARLAEEAADKSALEANRVSNENEQNLYYADMRLAEEATRNPTGFMTARETLNKWNDRERDLRGWEWFWLDNRTHRELDSIPGYRIFNVVEMQDGEHIMFGHGEELWIYNLRQKQVTRKIPSTVGVVDHLELSDDEKLIAVNNVMGEITNFALMDCESGQLIEQRAFGLNRGKFASPLRFGDGGNEVWLTAPRDDASKFVQIHRYKIHESAWEEVPTKALPCAEFDTNAEGSRLALVSPSGFMEIYDTQSWQVVQRMELPVMDCKGVSWNPRQPEIAVASRTRGIFMVYPDEKRYRHFFDENLGWNCVDWSRDGDRIITGNQQNSIIVMDPHTGRVVDRPDGNIEAVADVTASNLSSRMFSVAYRSVRVWDLEKALPVRQVDLQFELVRSDSLTTRSRISWHPTKGLVIQGSSTSVVIPYSSKRSCELDFHNRRQVGLGRLTISHDGKHVAGYRDDGFVVMAEGLDEATTGGCPSFELARATKKERPPGLAWSPDSDRLLICGKWSFLWSPSEDHPVKIEEHNSGLSFGGWSPSGNFLAVPHAHGRLKLFDSDSLAELLNQEKKGDSVAAITDFAVAFSPDDSKVCSAGNLGAIKVFDRKSGVLLNQLNGHTNKIWGVDWSPDGQRIASASEDKTVRIWDTKTMRTSLVLKFDDYAESVSWSPDSSKLAVTLTDSRLFIFDGTSREAKPDRRADQSL